MSETITPTHQLPAGTMLSDKYEIIRTLGEGGFGITYMGRNKVLDIPVAIKEYYPHGYANRSVTYDLAVTITDTTKNSYFAKWKDKFLNEARTLAKFSNISNIVNVLDFFEQNGTAYIVMEFLNGQTLSDYVSRNGVFNADRLCRIMIPMLRSLNKIHQKKLIHRDISPDNIMVMPDGSLKLFDFGAARDYSETTQRSLSVMLKPGFAPEEQYRSRGLQGPWTDVYAACATMYFCITGIKPDDSLQRAFSDELKPPSELGICISPPIEEAILMGMSIKSEDRFRTAEALATAFERGLSVSEQTAPSKSAVNLLRRQPRANKNINPRDNHTEIVRTELEKHEANTEKKTKNPGISKNAAKLNKKVIIEVLSGVAACGIMLTIAISSANAPRSPAVSDEKQNDSIDGSSLMSEDTTAIGLRGTWNGSTYSSDYLGFKCVLDSDWFIDTEAELAANYGKSDMSEESIREVLDSKGVIVVMNAVSTDNDGIVNHIINIIIEDTQFTKTPTNDMYFKFVLDTAKRQIFVQYGVNSEISETTVRFCSENKRGFVLKINTGNVICYQVQIPIFKDNYIATVGVSASSQQEAEMLLERFSKL